MSGNHLLKLELQLDNYADDMIQADSFQVLENHVDLLGKHVKTQKA
jgi:hypothetical protein